GQLPETLKQLPANVHNHVIGNNARALAAAQAKAQELGYRTVNLGPCIEGETAQVAMVIAGVARSVLHLREPVAVPACILVGGETTVTLGPNHGLGGRNQEFVLAAAGYLGDQGLEHVTVLSGGTDGEDGPTDAAGAIADADTLQRARQLGLSPQEF